MQEEFTPSAHGSVAFPVLFALKASPVQNSCNPRDRYMTLNIPIHFQPSVQQLETAGREHHSQNIPGFAGHSPFPITNRAITPQAQTFVWGHIRQQRKVFFLLLCVELNNFCSIQL